MNLKKIKVIPFLKTLNMSLFLKSGAGSKSRLTAAKWRQYDTSGSLKSEAFTGSHRIHTLSMKRMPASF